MKKCFRCNVSIMDETNVCPLCRQVLRKDETDPDFSGNMYPDLRNMNHTALLVKNIVLFLSLTLETASLMLAVMLEWDLTWSLIMGMILIYLNMILRLSIIGKSGYFFRILFGIVFSVVLLAAIDALTGYRGWSLEIVYPAGIILLNIAIGILMIICRRHWQSYMMPQILAIFLSIPPLILLAMGKIHFAPIAIGACGLSVFFFLGTLIIGDYRARNELKRRFHI